MSLSDLMERVKIRESVINCLTRVSTAMGLAGSEWEAHPHCSRLATGGIAGNLYGQAN